MKVIEFKHSSREGTVSVWFPKSQWNAWSKSASPVNFAQAWAWYSLTSLVFKACLANFIKSGWTEIRFKELEQSKGIFSKFLNCSSVVFPTSPFSLLSIGWAVAGRSGKIISKSFTMHLFLYFQRILELQQPLLFSINRFALLWSSQS